MLTVFLAITVLHQGAGDTEISELDVAFSADQNVTSFQIAATEGSAMVITRERKPVDATIFVEILQSLKHLLQNRRNQRLARRNQSARNG